MNDAIQADWSMVEGTQAMRAELISTLTDADLSFNPGGSAMTLGALCREMGEIDYSYTQSLKTFSQEWSYHNTDPAVLTSVSALTAWFQALEADMKATVEGLSEADLKKEIGRNGWAVAPNVQLQIYLQALLIFFGKATIYLKVMNKPLTAKLQDWIG